MSKEVYRLYTAHGSQMFLDNQQTLRHYDPATAHYSLNPVYMRVSDGSRSLFTIRDNLFKYIVTIDGQGKVVESQSPVVLECIDNEDGSFSIAQNRRFWSAQRNTGAFVLAPKNLGWEHFTPDKAEFELTREYIPPVIKNFVPEDEPQREPKLENPDVTVPAISVIISMYNVEDYIEDCLISVLNQSFINYELIVVDDCSTDHSVEIVEGMIDKFNGRLKLIRLEVNNGVGAIPRNIGLSYAIGEYVYFMDSDDIIVRNTLESFYAVAESNHADVVHTSKCWILSENKHYHDANPNSLRHIINKKTDSLTFIQRDISARLIDFNRSAFGFGVAPWHHLFRRKFLVENKITFPYAASSDDTAVAFYAICCAKIYIHIPATFYMYRERSGSLTKNENLLYKVLAKHIKIANSIFIAVDNFMDALKFFVDHPNFKQMIYRRFLDFYINGNMRLRPYYQINAESVVFNIVHKFFDDNVRFSDSFIAYLIVTIELQHEALSQKSQQLQKLSNELKTLTSRASTQN